VPFDVTLLEPQTPTSIVLFAVGAGGNPERHLPLLNGLARRGSCVVAPHFERLLSPRPTFEELHLRARHARLALDAVTQSKKPFTGVGHSIGATILMAMAGGQIWIDADRKLCIQGDERLTKLVLLNPATGFFQAPGALEKIRAPMLVWAGTEDTMTPLAQVEFLQQKLLGQLQIDVRVVEGAGHFSFMNILPPKTVDTLTNREALLADLEVEIHQFVTPSSTKD
jgi:pimeloyl-ACP methyl ester carboxylesterase